MIGQDIPPRGGWVMSMEANLGNIGVGYSRWLDVLKRAVWLGHMCPYH